MYKSLDGLYLHYGRLHRPMEVCQADGEGVALIESALKMGVLVKVEELSVASVGPCLGPWMVVACQWQPKLERLDDPRRRKLCHPSQLSLVRRRLRWTRVGQT